MTVKNVLKFLLWITLSSAAFIGGATEKWWLVLAVVPCFAMWVLYLLVQQEKMESSLKTADLTLTQVRTELDNYKKLQVRRTDLLRNHAD
jgi:hypothetical protein